MSERRAEDRKRKLGLTGGQTDGRTQKRIDRSNEGIISREDGLNNGQPPMITSIIL